MRPDALRRCAADRSLPSALGLLALALLLAGAADAGSFNRIPGGGGRSGVGSGGGGGISGTEERGLAADRETMAVDRRSEADAEVEPEDAADEAPAARDAEDEEASRRTAEAEEEEGPVGEPTLGRACIYGPGGRVIYAPEGRPCAAEETARRTAPPAARSGGRCILGAGGRVLHAPAGVDCGS